MVVTLALAAPAVVVRAKGTLSFRNTLQQVPPFSSPCCPTDIYQESAILTIDTDFTANFSSPGVTLSCGPSPPGWFAFERLYLTGKPNCYAGNITVLTPGGPTPFGGGRISLVLSGNGTITVKTSVLGNANDPDCTFGKADLTCTGTGPSFFQPIIGEFLIVEADNEWTKKVK